MKVFSIAAVCLGFLASTHVFAQGKTRAEVYQELVEARKNGLDYVTDTSYPDIDPMFAQEVARMKQQRVAQTKVDTGDPTH
ncbi:DUF4148 domain-containing protein [Paraburkholderia sp. 2C]|jgi:uncharacterized protein DUF4148